MGTITETLGGGSHTSQRGTLGHERLTRTMLPILRNSVLIKENALTSQFRFRNLPLSCHLFTQILPVKQTAGNRLSSALMHRDCLFWKRLFLRSVSLWAHLPGVSPVTLLSCSYLWQGTISSGSLVPSPEWPAWQQPGEEEEGGVLASKATWGFRLALDRLTGGCVCPAFNKEPGCGLSFTRRAQSVS